MNTGVYKIENIINRKFYIGSTSWGFKKRWNTHLRFLRKNKHDNPHLQYSWNKHGEHNFKFEIIEVCDKSNCFIREQYYIDTLHPQYNILPNAGTVRGYKHTAAIKILIGAASAGKNHPQYSGEYVFFNPVHGFFVGGLVEFSNKFNLRKITGYNLKNKKLHKSHGWIFIGNHPCKYPDDIKQFYYNRIYNNRPIYSFYHKNKGIFTGTVPDFIKTHKFQKKHRSAISAIVLKKRKMAWGWIIKT